jgi:hypothetical protein
MTAERRSMRRGLTFSLGAATLVSLEMNFIWAAGGFWINLSTTLIGLIVAVNYVEHVVERERRRVWIDTSRLIASRLQFVSHAIITNTRAAVGISAKQLPLDSLDLGDKSAYLRLAETHIEPALFGLIEQLNEVQWKALAHALRIAYDDCDKLLANFGDRLQPAEFRELLSIQDDARAFLSTYQMLPDVLGVPDDRLAPSKRVDTVKLKHSATQSCAEAVISVVRRARILGLTAIDHERDAAE